jgi:hypothetical protein
MPPAPPDYFAATEAWLLEQPGRATAGGVRKRRLVAPDLARHTANRIRRATLASLNARVEPGLCASCYGGRPDATRRGQVASRRCEREVAGYLAWYWQARWPDRPAASPLPDEPVGVPQGSPISGVLANVFLSAFDRALERAGIVFLRYLDDVTILVASPAALGAGLGTAIHREPRQAPAEAAVFPGLSPDEGAFRL